jgi:uncharacterized protein YbcI
MEGGPMSSTQPTYRPDGRMASEIATGLVQLIGRYTGRGPTKARTTLNTNVVLVVFENTMTKAEHSLAAAGKHESVREMRASFREQMALEASSLVEGILGRAVRGTIGDISSKLDVAAEVFLLDPIPENGEVVLGESD